MILSIHMVAGAIMGGKLNIKPALVLVFALLSHFILDFVPHFEYAAKPLTISLDLFLGIMIVIVLMRQDRLKAKLIAASAFVAILPDAPALIKLMFGKLGNTNVFNIFVNKSMLLHNYFHTKIYFMVPEKIAQTVFGTFILAMALYCIGSSIRGPGGRKIKAANGKK